MINKRIDSTNFLKILYNFIISIDIKNETTEIKKEKIVQMYKNKVAVDYAMDEKKGKRFYDATKDAVSDYIELYYKLNPDEPKTNCCYNCSYFSNRCNIG